MNILLFSFLHAVAEAIAQETENGSSGRSSMEKNKRKTKPGWPCLPKTTVRQIVEEKKVRKYMFLESVLDLISRSYRVL